MALKKEKKDKKKIVNEKESIKKTLFNIPEVILIMIITAICTITITIKVSYTINKTSKKIKTEAELSELIDIYNSINDDYYKDINKEELINSAINGMLIHLNDPYTVLLSEEESENINKELDGEYTGIGAEIRTESDGTFIVNRVYDNSPASKAGLKEKDQLLKVDGESLKEKNIKELSALLKKSKGTEISVTVLRNGKELSVTIKVGKVEIQSVEYNKISENGKSYSYIKIKTFAKNTYEQFKDAIEKFKKDNSSGIILDLRGNTGGHVAIAQSIAGMFLNKNDIVYQLNKKGNVEKIKTDKEKIIDTKLVILVDSQTASASEILTAALKDNLKVNVVGVKTFGKGKVQKMRTLKNGSTIKYTIQSWLTPNGEEIDGNGIEPTVEVKQSTDYKKNPIFEYDNQYKKALEIISTK